MLQYLVTDMACEALPAPNELTSEKIQNLLCSGVTSIEQLPSQTQDLKTGTYRRFYCLYPLLNPYVR